MKASELNGTHLGQMVAVWDDLTKSTFSGILAGVNHEAARVSERAICTPENSYTLGRREVTITFICGTTITVRPDAQARADS